MLGHPVKVLGHPVTTGHKAAERLLPSVQATESLATLDCWGETASLKQGVLKSDDVAEAECPLSTNASLNEGKPTGDAVAAK